MEKIKEMSIDLETYSDVDIKKSGVYKYADHQCYLELHDDLVIL